MPYTTINKGSIYFNPVLYTGNGSIQSITGVGFKPDLIWIKGRSSQAVNWHGLFDSVRGTAGGALSSNLTNAEPLETNLSSFNSNGFTFSNAGNFDNTSTVTFVSWNWLASNTTVSNTAGTITSTVSANTTAGFSIVSYTGTGSAATIGHGLGAVPRMIIVKNRDQADAWQVYHAANTANPETDYLVLNTTAATADNIDRWNDTLPTSTLFSIGNGVEVNTNTEKYIAYCFADVKGYSKFGSYTGNSNSDGPFIYTGFRPSFIMYKNSSNTGSWGILDTVRSPYNPSFPLLQPDTANAEVSVNPFIDALSNGFKYRTSGTDFNTTGNTYIYMAFAENPFVSSGGIPVTAR